MILDERGKKYLLKEDCEFQSDLGSVTKEQIDEGMEILSEAMKISDQETI